jgi:hypothetical protein
MKNAWSFVTFSYLWMMWCLSTVTIKSKKSCAVVQNMLQLLPITDTYNFRTYILEWQFYSCHSNQYLCRICTLEIHLLQLLIFQCSHTVGNPVFSRFEVFRVMSLRIQVFCDVTLWQWVTGSWLYEGIYCIDIQQSSSTRRLASSGESVVLYWYGDTFWLVNVASKQIRRVWEGSGCLFKCWDLITRWHCVTFWKTWILDSVRVITLASRYRPYLCNYHKQIKLNFKTKEYHLVQST